RRRRERGTIFAAAGLRDEPRVTPHEGAARQRHELHEIAARDVLVLLPVDGEVAAPLRLLRERRPVRRARALLVLLAHLSPPSARSNMLAMSASAPKTSSTGSWLTGEARSPFSTSSRRGALVSREPPRGGEGSGGRRGTITLTLVRMV